MKTRFLQARILILAGLALLALLGLAASLNALEFDPGSPMPLFHFGDQITSPDLPPGWQRVALAALRVLMIAFWLLLPVFILLMIFNKRFRRQFLRDMLIMMPMFVALYFFYRARSREEGVAEELPAAGFDLGELEQGFTDAGPAAPVYTPPDPAVMNMITTLIAVLIALAVLGAVWFYFRRVRARQLEPLRMIQEEAQSALEAIEAGGDLRDAILRAYQQMTQALKQFRNIQRDQYMTPHEFESLLAQRGMPRAPVHQLTELFEQVRYGGVMPGRVEERAAVASLSAIVAACQRQGSERS